MHRAVYTFPTTLLALAVCGLCLALTPLWAASPSCPPTRADSLGPFYEPNAPERDSTGQGPVIAGVVRAGPDCRPLDQALIEWWSANTHGDYDAAHRAVQRTGPDGRYHYSTDFPGRYPGRPSHLHVRVTAPGYNALVTQVYPQAGQSSMDLDLVLRPH